jgi:hypothetical protein
MAVSISWGMPWPGSSCSSPFPSYHGRFNFLFFPPFCETDAGARPPCMVPDEVLGLIMNVMPSAMDHGFWSGWM